MSRKYGERSFVSFLCPASGELDQPTSPSPKPLPELLLLQVVWFQTPCLQAAFAANFCFFSLSLFLSVWLIRNTKLSLIAWKHVCCVERVMLFMKAFFSCIRWWKTVTHGFSIGKLHSPESFSSSTVSSLLWVWMCTTWIWMQQRRSKFAGEEPPSLFFKLQSWIYMIAFSILELDG